MVARTQVMGGGIIHSYQGNLNVVIPANGFVVFVKQ
jgi:hypothetical protein